MAASSSARCLANQIAYPEFPVASGMTDTWVRVQLWTLGVDSTLSTWVSGADLWALLGNWMTKNKNYPSPYLVTTQWQCFTAAASSGFTAGQKLDVAPQLAGSSLVHNGSYVAVRVDQNGGIIGVVGIDGNSGTAIAQSCWTSFARLKA